MADEDEIDVLGDFSLDNLLCKNETGITSCYDSSVLSSQNSELLGCDYGLHSQWLLDTTPTNWYGGSGHDFATDETHSATNTSLGFDEVICTDNKTDDTGWTEEEKNLLEKGLEIFGKSSVRLSQFISSKTPSQVKHYLKNYYSVKNSLNPSYLLHNTFGNDSEKQVQLNEVIVHSEDVNLPKGFTMTDIIEDAQIPASIEEVIAVVSTAKPTVQNLQKSPKKKSPVRRNTDLVQSIFKTKSSVPKKRFKQNTMPPPVKKQKTRPDSKSEMDSTEEVSRGRVLPVSTGEEVIKIQKQDSESDTEIDVDIDVSSPISHVQSPPRQDPQLTIQDEALPTTESTELKPDEPNLLDNLDESILQFLMSPDVPTKPLYIKENEITEIEKFVHSKFFDGRPTKTPMKYLKIRNHIVDYWLANRPLYCTKTSVRQGLKNCGDVNCIGRIHQYLEQIGVINFGCIQTNYVRPLLQIFGTTKPGNTVKDKTSIQGGVGVQRNEVMRPRMKKKYNIDGEGGYTMMHNEHGDIIETTVVNKDKQNKPRTNRRQNIKLIYCKNFCDEYMAPYTVDLEISALLTIDLHAHSATIEVMGLLGGKYDELDRKLRISRYVPCRGLDHSNTHCDMCPVSQSEASEVIQKEGLEVIGWFHSHPTFFPNPSQQDIDTQLNMQLYLSNEFSPFVGVILSPFRSMTMTPASEYRCLIVDKHQTTKDGTGVPYKFQVNVVSDNFRVDAFLRCARYIFTMHHNIPREYMVDFEKPYFQDTSVTFLEKLLASFKLHLARCTDINKMTCDAIVQGITSLCLNSFH